MMFFKEWVPWRRKGDEASGKNCELSGKDAKKEKEDKVNFLLDEMEATNLRIGILNNQCDAMTTSEEEATIINAQIAQMVAYQNMITARLRFYGKMREVRR